MDTATLPTTITDPINARILSISEDKIQGFQPNPLATIAAQSGLDLVTVTERIAALLRAGTIRRVRQTLMATSLARGSLVAWQVPEEKLHAAFDYLYHEDPFSGHVVIRSTDTPVSGARYRLWTTVKVPQGFSLEKHARYLQDRIGALSFRLMPARCLFVLGVGHVRRKGMPIGSKAKAPADVIDTHLVELSDLDWNVLTALKREFSAEEFDAFQSQISNLKSPISQPPSLWAPRAAEAGVDLETFHAVARSLNERGVIGRFSTFLEHVKPLKTGEQVTKYNALFHWAVPAGREIEAGREVGRFHIMTHAYWREGGPEFNHVNIMGVAHGTDKQVVLAHKAAMDEHLAQCGIPVSYTSVFWGGRSEIKPSEIAPEAYRAWCVKVGIDPQTMRP
jgi:hypothetical protein